MPFEESLVAIFGSSENPVGAGVLVETNLVLTCAHVVNSALNRPQNAKGRPAGNVRLKRHVSKNQTVNASVDKAEDAWSDPPASRQPGADLCLLRVLDSWEGEIEMVRLRDFDNLVGRRFRVGGFPKGWDFDIADGKVIGRDANGLYLLRREDTAHAVVSTQPKGGVFSGEQRPAGTIHAGFSGAPVEVGGKIAGLVGEARESPSDDTGYMIPVATFPRRIALKAESEYRTYLEGIGQEPNAVPCHISRSVIRKSDSSGAVPVHSAATASQAKPESIEDALEASGKIVLVAEPGLGKSTALNYLEISVASQGLEVERTGWRGIPIRIELKTYAGEKELEILLAARVNEVLRRNLARLSDDADESTRILKDWLVGGKHNFLLLLDGLDEVPDQFHLPIRSALKALLNYPHRVVISCRIADYDDTLHGSAALYALQRLQPQEIDDYLQQRLGASGKAHFQRRLGSNNRQMTLASNPLLLEIMVSIAEENPRGKIPANSGLLLKQSVDLMRRRKEREGIGLKVPPDVVATALARLGLEMLERKQVMAALAEVREWPIPGNQYKLDEILDAANEWRLLKCDGKHGEPVEFIHPLFGEYFAAEFLHSELRKSKFNYKEFPRERLWDRRWDEAIVMLTGISSQPAGTITWLAQEVRIAASTGALFIRQDMPLFWFFWGGWSRVNLLMRCWRTGSARDRSDVRTAVVDALRAVVRYSGLAIQARQSVGIAEARAAISGLAEIGDKRAVDDLERFAERGQGPYRNPLPVLKWLFPDIFEEAREAAQLIRRKTV